MMNQSESIENLINALVTFQGKAETLPQPATGYGYTYTPLDKVIEYIRPMLADVGLCFAQFPDTPPNGEPAVTLTTRLMHTSGEWLEATMLIPVPQVGKANMAQNYGAALTYARRYALTSILGLATDEDVDAAPVGNGQPRKPVATSKPEVKTLKPTATQYKSFHATGKDAYGDEWDDKRPELVKAISSKRADGPIVTSSKKLYRAELVDLTNGMKQVITDRKKEAAAE
jgi:hypothetical protein